MKIVALLVGMVFAWGTAFAQLGVPSPTPVINGTFYASAFGQWSVPQGNNGDFAWASPTACTVSGGGVSFPAFTVGTPVTIIDADPSKSEVVTPTAVRVNVSGCQVTTTATMKHYSFKITSATAGLQESINYAQSQNVMIIVSSDFARLGGTTGTITSATGNSNISILDERSSIVIPYIWSGSAYVAAPFGGTGAVLSTPQYRLFIQPNPGNQSVAGPSTTSTNAVAPILQGAANSDLFTNVAGLFANSFCSVSGCMGQVPRTSPDTTQLNASQLPANTFLQDLRTGQQNYFHNPLAPISTNPQNDIGDTAISINSLWDRSDQYLQGASSGGQVSDIFSDRILSYPGINLGPSGGPGGSSVSHVFYSDSNIYTRGIHSGIATAGTRSGAGDFQGLNCEWTGIAGLSALSDEGYNCHRGRLSQQKAYLTATANATGVGLTTIPITGIAGLPKTFDGSGAFLNLTTAIFPSAGNYVTGPATVLAGTAVMKQHFSAWTPALTTAYAAMPDMAVDSNPNRPDMGTPLPTTRTYTGTSTFGTFPVGTQLGCLTGGQPEHVQFTASAPSGGTQAVTVTYQNNHFNFFEPVTLFSDDQGGACGKFLVPFLYHTVNHGIPYVGAMAVGSLASGDILYASDVGGRTLGNGFGQYAVKYPITNLSASGLTVTATGSGISPVIDRTQTALITDSTNTAFNGGARGPQFTFGASGFISGLTWTVLTPITGTSASANIGLDPVAWDSYMVLCAAQVLRPDDSAGVHVEPNNCTWTAGDQVESLQGAAFRAAEDTQILNQETPAFDSRVIDIGYQGSGVNTNFPAILIRDNNDCNFYYFGCGGAYGHAPTIVIDGPNGGAISMNEAPLNGAAIIGVGFDHHGDNTRNITLFNVANNPIFLFNPSSNTITAGQQFTMGPITSGGGPSTFNADVTTRNLTSFDHDLNGTASSSSATIAFDTSGIRKATFGYLYAYGTHLGPAMVLGGPSQGSSDAIVGIGTGYIPTLHVGSPDTSGLNMGVFLLGVSGATTYTYTAVTRSANGVNGTFAQTQTITVGAAVPNNQVQIEIPPGVQSIDIYRTVGGATQGKIGTVSADSTAAINPSFNAQGRFAFNDANLVGDGTTPPTTNTTGVADINGSPICTVATGCGANVLKVSFTTTAAVSETVTLTGMTSSGHCAAPGPTNAAAGTMIQNATPVFLSGYGANVLTFNHVATAGATFDLVCTPN